MLSKITYAICAICMLYTSFVFYPRWKQPEGENLISWDAAGYYRYLPAIFIYRDLKQLNNVRAAHRLENGNYILKYTSGMALMELPSFTIANILAKPLGYSQDGFSPPYPLAIQIEGILIALIGIWYFRKLLLLFYKDSTVTICIFLLVMGTNYLDFGAINLGMSHSWLFTIYTFVLLNTYYFHKNYKYKYATRIGLLIGLATLTRPTEIIACLIPLLWGIESVSVNSIKDRYVLLLQQWRKVVVTSICIVMVISIQLIYWKYVSGYWLVYSYQDQGFSWLRPHIIDYALSFRSGWLNYSPMLLFALLGILPFIKKGKNKVAILVFFAVNYYIVSAWDIWWYGGRAMIQSYPVIFFPFASLIETVSRQHTLKWVTAVVAMLFLYFNIWLTYHQHKGTMYTPDNMTKAYYLRVAGRWSVPDETIKLRDNPDLFEGNPKNMQLIYSNDFENDTNIYCPVPALQGSKSIYIDKEHQNSNVSHIPFTNNSKAKWIRATADFKCLHKEWELWKMSQFIIHFYNKEKEVKVAMIRIQRFLNEEGVKKLYIDTRIPKKKFDRISISLWNADSEKDVLMDNLLVYSFDD